MARRRTAEDLSVDELRKLLIEKKRLERQGRLDTFRKTGRLVAASTNAGQDIGPALHSSARAADTPEEQRRIKLRRFFDRFLFVVEVGAVLGLLFVLFNGINLIGDLNREVAAALKQPSPSPTPIILAVVLPSGHTPPGAPGGVRPNDAEIPEHLRPVMQSLAAVPQSTPGLVQAVRIKIPAIEVDAPVVQGDGWDQLKKGVGQHAGTADPGQKGNMVLSAHNDVFGEIFRNLDQLKEGDMIIISTNQRQYVYLVTTSAIVPPSQVDVMNATETANVTLISCYPYLIDNQRIVITAELQNNS
ncbi:MAG: class D sortase [Anaerolineaceae bacterium]|nr:class D sortase [Anaerolineaceae bacterium]